MENWREGLWQTIPISGRDGAGSAAPEPARQKKPTTLWAVPPAEDFRRLRLYGALWLLAAMAIGAASGAMFGTAAADGGSNTAPSVFGLISAVCVAFIALVRLLPTAGKLGAKLAAWEAAGRGVRSALAALALSLPQPASRIYSCWPCDGGIPLSSAPGCLRHITGDDFPHRNIQAP